MPRWSRADKAFKDPLWAPAPSSITFSATTAGQTSKPQNITLKSLGARAVSLSTIQISGANAADFTETDNCISSPVLPTNHTCTISITYAPTSVGTSQATLFVTDNAAGSPQGISLSGTAVQPAPASPDVSLNPASALNFPGTPTQGTSTNPQNVTVTNSGDAPLQILSAVLSGSNSSDFSIASDTCSGSIAAKASCTISLIFSPLASGLRTTTLTITDNAANSPQSISINGTAIPAVTIASIGGTTTATLSAGQTAQFNLQAIPGAGFNGTLSFSCSGVPFGAACTVPGSLPISNGGAVSFTISVSTLGASQVAPFSPIPSSPLRPSSPWVAMILLAAISAALLSMQSRNSEYGFPRTVNMAAAMALSLSLILSGIGCGGGGGAATSTKASLEPVLAAPSIQPGAGTYTSAQSVSITASTAGATIYYTTDGTAPTSSSPSYSAPFSLNSATTVQAMAAATGYSNSAVSNAVFKFRTPAATYITVTATPSGSSKACN